ncbi:MAG TPA: GAF domain-containing protein [Candidatus Dormibacteraeota bacterium]|nr:GAF domain-containing protein [Candidatus Dormibacteraeota bacterium]
MSEAASNGPGEREGVALESDHVLTELNDRIADARLGPEAILNAVTSALSRLRRGTWVAYLIGKDPRNIKVVAANEKNPQLARYLEDMHRSGEASALAFADQVIESGEPLLLPHLSRESFLSSLRADVHTYFTKKSPPAMAPWVDVAIMAVPMRARGATVGTLALYEARPDQPLTPRDVEWLQPIADRTGLAADNAQLYVDANSRLERLAAVRSVSLAMAASGDLRLTLQVILDHVLAGLAVDAADVMLMDESDGNLVSAAHAGFRSTSVPDYRLEPGDIPHGRLADRPRIEILTGGTLAKFKRRTLFAREGFRAYCAAGLNTRGRNVGVLELFHRTALDPDDEWLGFLDAIAGMTAMAIDNAAMSDALRRSSHTSVPTGAPRLTNLERQILGQVVEGATNMAIARALHLSQSTVKFHVRQILQKVGVGNRTELARLATREGWT